MNDKHFIWIVPFILIIGFIIGYISGLNMPNKIEIEFQIDKDTQAFMDKYYNLTYLSANSTENLQKECLNLSNSSFNSYATCDFDSIDMRKYYCCEGEYKVNFHESNDWMCDEERWKNDLNRW